MWPRPTREGVFSQAATALVLLLALAAPMIAIGANLPSVDTVAEGLTCQCGCGLTVANCNHPQCEFSVPVRTQIETMLKQGMSRTAILTSFRTKYGEKILSAPTTEGFNLLAWIMPFVALTGGGGLIFVLFGRWRSRSSAAGAKAADVESATFDPALRKALESAIKEDL
jgi:cytochrome c-type biogenesis protein CcmH/NrfF